MIRRPVIRDNRRGVAAGGTTIAPPQQEDLVAWWRADSGRTMNGSDVSHWLDRNGTHTLRQLTPAGQPAYVANHSDHNGHPALVFAAADSQSMTLVTDSDDFDLTASGLVVAVPYKLNSDTGAFQALINKWTTAQKEWFLSGDSGTGIDTSRFGVRNSADTGNFTADSVSDPASPNVPHLAIAAYDGTSTISVDFDSDAQQTTGSVTVRTSTALLTIGLLGDTATQPLDASVPEILVYKAPPTAALVSGIKTYVNARYGRSF